MAAFFPRVESIYIATDRTRFDKAISHTTWRGQIVIEAVMVPYCFLEIRRQYRPLAGLLLLGQCVATDRQDTR